MKKSKSFKEMTPFERLEHIRKYGVKLFPNLTDEEKREVLFIKDEPIVGAGKIVPKKKK